MIDTLYPQYTHLAHSCVNLSSDSGDTQQHCRLGENPCFLVHWFLSFCDNDMWHTAFRDETQHTALKPLQWFRHYMFSIGSNNGSSVTNSFCLQFINPTFAF